MKRLVLTMFFMFFALAASAHAANWLTITGDADNPNSDYVQVDPAVVEVGDGLKSLVVRVNHAANKLTDEGVAFRSFEAPIVVDCRTKSAYYTESRAYKQPAFHGAPLGVQLFKPFARPVRFESLPGNPSDRVIKAACVAVAAVDEPVSQIRKESNRAY